MKKLILLIGLVPSMALAAPELPALNKYYNIYTDHMRELPTSSPDWRPINPNSLAHFFFNDPTSPEDVSHKEDKGAGGYYDYSLTDDWTDPKTLQYHNATYEYQTIVHFKPDRTIWLVSYFLPEECDQRSLFLSG